MPKIETYSASPAQIGNSRGYRMDAALFQAHPELHEGSFEAAYLGAGTILLRPRTPDPAKGRVGDGVDDIDPVAAAYLAWSERAMIEQPNLLREMSMREFELAEALIAGMRVDLDRDRLPDDFELP